MVPKTTVRLRRVLVKSSSIYVCALVFRTVSPMNARGAQSLALSLDSMNCSPPGFSVHRILQARILEWVAISSSRRSS